MKTFRACLSILLSATLLAASPGAASHQAFARTFGSSARGAAQPGALLAPGAGTPALTPEAVLLAPALSPTTPLPEAAASLPAAESAAFAAAAAPAFAAVAPAVLPPGAVREGFDEAQRQAAEEGRQSAFAGAARPLPEASEQAGPAAARESAARDFAARLGVREGSGPAADAVVAAAPSMLRAGLSAASSSGGRAAAPAVAAPAPARAGSRANGFAALGLFGLSLPWIGSGPLAWAVAGVAAGVAFAFILARLSARPAKPSAAKLDSPISLEASPADNLAALKADIAARTEAAPAPRGPAPRIAIVAAQRLPQGKFPGSLQSRWTPKKLGAYLVNGLLRSAGVVGGRLETMVKEGVRVKVLFGSVDTSDAPNMGREVAVEARLPVSIPGTGIGKNCGTSLEAASLAMAELLSGRQDMVIAGGAEIMSGLPQILRDPKVAMDLIYVVNLPAEIRKAPWHKRPLMYLMRGWKKLTLSLRLALSAPRYAIAEGLSIDGIKMARTAQILADALGITRDDQDWFAFGSQSRASEAYKRGDFAAESLPFVGKDGQPAAGDQGVRHGAKRESYRKLPTVFGTKDVTAANASQISDGASGVILMTEEKAEELGFVPLAYLRSAADAGLEPQVMGLGPAYALPLALKQAGMALEDVEALELNEAFAAQALAVMAALGLDAGKVNPVGGAIAVGHPLAASGTRLLSTLVHHMMRHGLTKGACSLCVGGGEGSAAVVTRDENGVPREFKDAVRAGLKARGVSEAVAERAVQALNGLPPLVKENGGDRRAYRSVLDFVSKLGALSGADAAPLVETAAGARELPENGSYARRLAAVTDRIERDLAAFAGPRRADYDHRYFKVSVDRHGVATVVIDRGPINALNLEVGDELRVLLDRLEADHGVRSVVFTANGGTFIGGADLNVIASVADEADARAKSESLQGLFDRIEGFSKPVVMAANGMALGGGVEIFMAGHLRMASAKASFTLPEMGLGFLPGAGGTQRAVRLMGLTKGLTFMNMGPNGTKDAFTAKADGLVDRVTAPADLLREAQEAARELADLNAGQKKRFFDKARALSRPVRLTPIEKVGVYLGLGTLIGAAVGLALALWFVSGAWLWAAVPAALLAGSLAGSRVLPGNGALIRRMVRKEVVKSGHPEYVTNVMNIIDAALEGIKKGPRRGLKLEAALFGKLAIKRLARLLVAYTLRKTGGPKREGFTDRNLKPAPIRRVGVVGAGEMGSGIGQLAAYRGIEVKFKEDPRFPGALERGIGRVRALFQGLVAKYKYSAQDLEAKMALVSGTIDEAEFAAFAPDLVIEAIRENMADKKALVVQLGRDLPPEAIIASNTSALSVTELALASGRPGKFVGMHYFNPPHVMPLVEVVLPDVKDFTPAQKDELAQTVVTVLEYLKQTGKVVVITQDRPGFVVNRLLIPYVNEANRLIEEGATVAEVEAVFKKLGFPMGPFEVADFVGLGLGKEVGTYLAGALPHIGRISPILPDMLAAGFSGQKAGKGYFLYKTVKDRKTGEDRKVIDEPNEAAVAEFRAAAGARSAARAVVSAVEVYQRGGEGAGLGPVRAALARARDYASFLEGQEWEGWTARDLLDFQRMSDPELVAALENLKVSIGKAERALDLAMADAEWPRALLLRSHRRAGAFRKISSKEIEERLLFLMANEAARILGEGVVASAADVDIALTGGAGVPTSLGGLLRYVSGRDLRYVERRLREFAAAGGGPAFEPAPLLVGLSAQGRGFYDGE